MSDVSIAAGEWVFRPGDPGDRAYLVREGRIELLAGSSVVAGIGPGEVFGEMSLVEERPRSLAARAAGPVVLTPMTRDEFEHLLVTDPARTRHYLRSLFERLRTLSARVGGEPSSADVPMAELVLDPVALPTAGPASPPRVPVVLHPLTRKAAETLPDEGLLLSQFPLRVGRAAEAHEPDGLALNDLWLLDERPYNVSRNHCEIDLDDRGCVVVRDRGSHLGCVVNEEAIGGRHPYGYAKLHPGENVLVIGGHLSPYQFRVSVG